jgi:hypothetical protein
MRMERPKKLEEALLRRKITNELESASGESAQGPTPQSSAPSRDADPDMEEGPRGRIF